MTTLILIAANYVDPDSPDRYTEGANCDRIEQDVTGRWWVYRGQSSWYIPDHRIMGVQRLIKTVANPDKAALPDYCERVHNGFQCRVCSKVFPTFQGVKVHHGKEHR